MTTILKEVLIKHGIKIIGNSYDNTENKIVIAGDNHLTSKEVDKISNDLKIAVESKRENLKFSNQISQLITAMDLNDEHHSVVDSKGHLSYKYRMRIPRHLLTLIKETLTNIYPASKTETSDDVLTITGSKPCDEKQLDELLKKIHQPNHRHDTSHHEHANDGAIHNKKLTQRKKNESKEEVQIPTPTNNTQNTNLTPKIIKWNNGYCYDTAKQDQQIKPIDVPDNSSFPKGKMFCLFRLSKEDFAKYPKGSFDSAEKAATKIARKNLGEQGIKSCERDVKTDQGSFHATKVVKLIGHKNGRGKMGIFGVEHVANDGSILVEFIGVKKERHEQNKW